MTSNEEIRAREQAATPGPWVTHRPSGEYVRNPETNFEVCMTRRSYDAEFIAHAREDIPWLLDENEQLKRLAGESIYTVRKQAKEIARLTTRVEELEAELAGYREAEPPCKVGDAIYILTADSPMGIEETKITKIELVKNSYSIQAPCVYDDWGKARWKFSKKDLNVRCFLTREEAKAALQGKHT